MQFSDKKVVVIGGTSGIGRAVADGAAKLGATVIVGSSTASKVEAERGKGADARTVDVKDEASLAAFFADVGPFDHLVYTAGDWGGPMLGGALDTLDLNQIAGVFTVRFWGALASIKHSHKQIRPGGSVTVTDGMIAHRPRKAAPVSVAMAGAVEHLVRGLALDLAPLRVNGVCPGYIETDIWAAMTPEVRATRLKVAERWPIPRAGKPDECAAAYLYLMGAGYTTGQVLYVEGGMSLV